MSDRHLLLSDGRRVDWRQALNDALLDVDVDSSRVIAEFWRLVSDDADDLDKYP